MEIMGHLETVEKESTQKIQNLNHQIDVLEKENIILKEENLLLRKNNAH